MSGEIHKGGTSKAEACAQARKFVHDQYLHLFWGFYYRIKQGVKADG